MFGHASSRGWLTLSRPWTHCLWKHIPLRKLQSPLIVFGLSHTLSGFILCVDGESFPCFHIHSIIDVSFIPRMVFAGAALSYEIFILQQTSYIFSTKSFFCVTTNIHVVSSFCHLSMYYISFLQRLDQSALLDTLRYLVIPREPMWENFYLPECKDD